MDALNIRHANAMPAPTWGWLRMNDTKIEIPAGLTRIPAASIDAEAVMTETSAGFSGALAELQERLDAARGDAADARACVQAALGNAGDTAAAKTAAGDAAGADAAGADAANATDDAGLGDLDIPALSRYQERATREEVALDVALAFETGMGRDAASYLNFLAGGTETIQVEEGTRSTATVRVTGKPGCAGAASIDVVAEPDATLDLVILLDAPGAVDAATPAPATGTATAAAPAGADPASPAGLIGSELRVFAGARSHVNVTTYLTADPGFTVLDDAGYVLDEGARVNVRHVVLGGSFTATGLAADLRGETARMDITTRYLAAGSDARDFNYIVRHRGRRTICNIDANGVLAGESSKILRGTIDLVHGCKGSEGTEHETVLIADDRVDNKTVPVILCDEDDVAGNHGATIGHVRPDQLFYLQSRGVSPEAAEALFIRAKLEDAALTAPDDAVRAAVARLGDALVPGFSADLAAENTLEEDAA